MKHEHFEYEYGKLQERIEQDRRRRDRERRRRSVAIWAQVLIPVLGGAALIMFVLWLGVSPIEEQQRLEHECETQCHPRAARVSAAACYCARPDSSWERQVDMTAPAD